jgi:hypothetical protein
MAEDERNEDFAAQAAERGGQTLLGELFEFMGENKKWWLAPIVVSVLALGALVLLGGTAAAPFIYTLF